MQTRYYPQGQSQVQAPTSSADAGTTYNSSIANSSINEETDTVYGQIQKHSNLDNPIFKRVSQKAKDQASARGLGNTTIAQSAATGAVMDKVGQWATKDAEIYSGRKTENQRAATHLESTSMTNKSNLVTGRERNAATLKAQQMQSSTQLRLGKMQQETARLDRQSRVKQASLDRNSRANIAHLDSTTKMDIAQMQRDTQLVRDKDDAIQSAWTNYQQGLAAIDPNAAGGSQNTQYSRLKDSFAARMTFLNQDFPDLQLSTTKHLEWERNRPPVPDGRNPIGTKK